MAIDNNIRKIVDFARPAKAKHQPQSTRDSDVFPGLATTHPKRTPQHLLGLLFAHGSRTRRASLPRRAVKLSVFTPGGKAAVKIRV